MPNVQAVPGQKIEVEVDPHAWPYRLSVGDVEQSAMPRKVKSRRGVQAFAYVRCPELGAGSWPLRLRDRNGVQNIGTVTIR